MEDKERMYTVTEVCRRFDITRKTLFYYDRTGLLTPSDRIGPQYHKVYDSEAVEKLQMIINYRNCGLSIAEIRAILKESDNNIGETLTLLESARKRLEREKMQKESELERLNQLISQLKRQ